MQLVLTILMLAQVMAPGWTEEEAVLTRALALRARALEAASGIPFTPNRVPKARLERLDFQGRRVDGQYDPETGDILLSASLIGDLNIELGKPLRLAAPEDVAVAKRFRETADHELGHALTDHVSRRMGRGSWFAVLETPDEHLSIGREVLAEGTAEWFERVMHPVAPPICTEECLPAGADDLRFYLAACGSCGTF